MGDAARFMAPPYSLHQPLMRGSRWPGRGAPPTPKKNNISHASVIARPPILPCTVPAHDLVPGAWMPSAHGTHTHGTSITNTLFHQRHSRPQHTPVHLTITNKKTRSPHYHQKEEDPFISLSLVRRPIHLTITTITPPPPPPTLPTTSGSEEDEQLFNKVSLRWVWETTRLWLVAPAGEGTRPWVSLVLPRLCPGTRPT